MLRAYHVSRIDWLKRNRIELIKSDVTLVAKATHGQLFVCFLFTECHAATHVVIPPDTPVCTHNM